ncbi:hypothetical protein BaRGS_00011757 [Batillaria attramentaria]|uniref:G-patch domain-containing protein n=1 Tax=Batillaria attramentaria TaxID=370345 RepID=A0ABD0LBQ5_9CAEN
MADATSKPASLKSPIPADNVGRRLLQKMGWTGGGVGKYGTGIQSPLRVGHINWRRGLGFRKAAATGSSRCDGRKRKMIGDDGGESGDKGCASKTPVTDARGGAKTTKKQKTKKSVAVREVRTCLDQWIVDFLTDYAASSHQKDLIFSHVFNGHERDVIHSACTQLNLRHKTKRTGKLRVIFVCPQGSSFVSTACKVQETKIILLKDSADENDDFMVVDPAQHNCPCQQTSVSPQSGVRKPSVGLQVQVQRPSIQRRTEELEGEPGSAAQKGMHSGEVQSSKMCGKVKKSKRPKGTTKAKPYGHPSPNTSTTKKCVCKVSLGLDTERGGLLDLEKVENAETLDTNPENTVIVLSDSDEIPAAVGSVKEHKNIQMSNEESTGVPQNVSSESNTAKKPATQKVKEHTVTRYELGIGTIGETPEPVFKRHLTYFLAEYVVSSNRDALIFPPYFSKSEFQLIHDVCGHLHLHSTKTNSNKNTSITVNPCSSKQHLHGEDPCKHKIMQLEAVFRSTSPDKHELLCQQARPQWVQRKVVRICKQLEEDTSLNKPCLRSQVRSAQAYSALQMTKVLDPKIWENGETLETNPGNAVVNISDSDEIPAAGSAVKKHENTQEINEENNDVSQTVNTDTARKPATRKGKEQTVTRYELGFGTIGETPEPVFKDHITHFLAKYVVSSNQDVLIFSPCFSKSELQVINNVCQRLKLHITKTSSGNSKTITVSPCSAKQHKRGEDPRRHKTAQLEAVFKSLPTDSHEMLCQQAQLQWVRKKAATICRQLEEEASLYKPYLRSQAEADVPLWVREMHRPFRGYWLDPK